MSNWTRRRFIARGATVGAAIVLGLMWADGNNLVRAQAAPVAKPAADPAASHDGNAFLDFSGRTEAAQSAQISPRVSSQLVQVVFREGAQVQKGQLLFELDSRSFQAALGQAQADLARAEAEMAVAETDLARMNKLVQSAAVSRAEADRAAAQAAAAKTAVQLARTKIDAARLDLDATRLTAPITGRIGRAEVDVGSTVRPGTVLTTIISEDPIHVYFDVPEKQYLQLVRRGRQARGSAELKDLAIPVRVGLADEQGFPREGKLDFVDNRCDPKTGTVRFRAVLPNPDRLLMPGLFVRVRMSQGGTP
jgi:membrane fusion protein, multidrug efflux system